MESDLVPHCVGIINIYVFSQKWLNLFSFYMKKLAFQPNGHCPKDNHNIYITVIRTNKRQRKKEKEKKKGKKKERNGEKNNQGMFSTPFILLKDHKQI